MASNELFTEIEEAREFAQAIVDTVREPFLVLDQDLRVLAASRSFYSAFKVSPDDTQGRLLYALGDGQWNIPRLRLLLENIIPERGVMEDYEVEHEFPVANSLQIIASIILMNARSVQSKETRLHLENTHQRVMSIAAVQKQPTRPGSALLTLFPISQGYVGRLRDR